jgi:hypothetical protein
MNENFHVECFKGFVGEGRGGGRGEKLNYVR